MNKLDEIKQYCSQRKIDSEEEKAKLKPQRDALEERLKASYRAREKVIYLNKEEMKLLDTMFETRERLVTNTQINPETKDLVYWSGVKIVEID